MQKIKTFARYFKDFLQYGQVRLVLASMFYLLTKKSIIDTRIFRGKLGYFLHRKGSIDFQFGNYAYEWNVKRFMLEQGKKHDVFIDIGANIGTYSILHAKNGLECIAFEPAYENYKALYINLMLNNLEHKVRIFNVGLNDQPRKAEFIFDPLNTGATHLSSIPAEDPEIDKRGKITQVELVRLDDMIEKLNIAKEKRILMKIDVEGMEVHVLRGAQEFIRKYPYLMITLESVHSGEQNIKEILNSIAEFEFDIIDDLNIATRKISNNIK